MLRTALERWQALEAPATNGQRAWLRASARGRSGGRRLPGGRPRPGGGRARSAEDGGHATGRLAQGRLELRLCLVHPRRGAGAGAGAARGRRPAGGALGGHAGVSRASTCGTSCAASRSPGRRRRSAQGDLTAEIVAIAGRHDRPGPARAHPPASTRPAGFGRRTGRSGTTRPASTPRSTARRPGTRRAGRSSPSTCVAAGPRWGANQYNNRDDDLGPEPLGIAFGLAGTSPREHTPPHCLRTWRRATEGARPSRVVVGHNDYFGSEPHT